MRAQIQTADPLLLVNAAHSIPDASCPELIAVDPRWPEVLLAQRAAALPIVYRRWKAASRQARRAGQEIREEKLRKLPLAFCPGPAIMRVEQLNTDVFRAGWKSPLAV